MGISDIDLRIVAGEIAIVENVNRTMALLDERVAKLEKRLLESRDDHRAWLETLGASSSEHYTRIEDLELFAEQQGRINDSTTTTLRMMLDEIREIKREIRPQPGNVVPIRPVVTVSEGEEPILIEFLNWLYEVFYANHHDVETIPREKVLGEFLTFRAHRFGGKS